MTATMCEPGASAGSSRPVAPRGPRFSVLVAVVVVAAIASMAAALTGPFLFDDVALIHGNHQVHGLEYWQQWLAGTLWDTNYDPTQVRHARGFWRPFVVTSYALDWWWGGGAPFSFHVTNLIVHGVNAALLARLLRGWVKDDTGAFFGALLFAVHPVQTEPVAWISGRTDSLCLLGMLLGALGFRRALAGARGGWVQLAAGLAIAFGSKEVAVLFPVLAIIESWAQRPQRGALDWATGKTLLRRVWPLLALSAGYVALHRSFVPSNPPHFGLTPRNAVPVLLEAWGRYSALLAWPHDLTLGRAQFRFEGAHIAPSPGYAALGVATLVLGGICAFRLRRSLPASSLGLLSYGVLALPGTGLAWLGYDVGASPRFSYVPMVGLALAAAAALSTPRGRSAPVRGVALAGLALAAALTFSRASDYSSSDAFWRREIAANEGYVPAQQYVLVRELNARRPRSALQLAHRWFRRSQEQGRPEAERVPLVLNIVSAALALTVDVDVSGLVAVERFAAALAEPRPARLRLERLGLDLRVAVGDAQVAGELVANRRLFDIAAAEAASRAGDDSTALRHVRRALDGCEDCWTLLSTSALILARAHELERALGLAARAARYAPPEAEYSTVWGKIEDAAAWQRAAPSDAAMRAVGFHSMLGAFGRAYRFARPAIEDPPADPAGVLALAELAYRAGDVQASRHLLERVMPAPAVRERLRQLSRSVAWQDQPSAPSEWVPN